MLQAGSEVLLVMKLMDRIGRVESGVARSSAPWLGQMSSKRNLTVLCLYRTSEASRWVCLLTARIAVFAPGVSVPGRLIKVLSKGRR